MEQVYIKWIDAMASDTEWKTMEDAIDWGANINCTIEEIGYLIDECDKYILLANRVNSDMVAGLMRIPKTYIVERKELIIKEK